jgi:hypothetical protein
MFSEDIQIYEFKKRRWERRTTKGVGWHPYLCSTLDEEGKWDDTFDQLLKKHVEDPAAPALRKLAQGETLDTGEHSAVALFMALTATRSPQMMTQMMFEHLNRLGSDDRKAWDTEAQAWQSKRRKSLGDRLDLVYMKEDLNEGINQFAPKLQQWLLQHKWHPIKTTRDRPFMISDWPVFGERTQDVRMVSFPVSSELAFVVIDGRFQEPPGNIDKVTAINRQTMARACEFVVCWKQDFPGDDCLAEKSQRALALP